MHPDRARSPISSLAGARHVAVIPARYHSTRLPGKPLADIGGRPMIEHVYRRAAASPVVDAVIVATDDERVRDAVEAFGGIAVDDPGRPPQRQRPAGRSGGVAHLRR